jgi:hypothetical protein
VSIFTTLLKTEGYDGHAVTLGGGVEMVSKKFVDKQLKRLGFNPQGWGRGEILELPNILLPGEEIYELVNGIYENGFALAIATDVRLLLVDKKPMNYLIVEDIRFDMISEIDYSHRLIGAEIHISTGTKDLRFRSYNQQRLRKVITHVQQCMAQAKKQFSQTQEGQSQHLGRINEQLQVYLNAQNEYQLQLQMQLSQEAQKLGEANIQKPEEPKPSHELSDYLFARSLLARYQKHTGKKLDEDLGGQPLALQAGQVQTSHRHIPTNPELHDLWSSGVKEVFGRHKPATGAQTSAPHHNSFEINPVSIVFSRLTALIRNRRFTQPKVKLSPDNISG